MGSTHLPHIAIFPFMAKGHTIPLIHLAHLIHRRRLATLTFFTTPLNAPFLRRSLADTTAAVVELPFPEKHNLPAGVESTDRLPSMSHFLPFLLSLDQLRPHFEAALARIPAVSFIISDCFLVWTNDSAAKLGIPRIAFYGMGNFATTVVTFVRREKPHEGLASKDEAFALPGLPHVKLTGADFWTPSDDPELTLKIHEFFDGVMEATSDSDGLIMNSFYELEPVYFDYWNKSFRPRSWCVGPVCLAAERKLTVADRTEWMEWLDERSAMGRPVVYVAFGTQADVSEAQLRQIAVGLERSGIDFLWVVRFDRVDLGGGFEQRVRGRGRVVRGWVDQSEILRHEGVKGFVSHCGWNSVMEGICAGTPILAWPMMAEQHLNAKQVVEELRVGVRVPARDGLVGAEEVERLVRELMVGEKGKEAAERVRELAGAARRAVGVGGSSWRTLELMIDEVCGLKKSV